MNFLSPQLSQFAHCGDSEDEIAGRCLEKINGELIDFVKKDTDELNHNYYKTMLYDLDLIDCKKCIDSVCVDCLRLINHNVALMISFRSGKIIDVLKEQLKISEKSSRKTISLDENQMAQLSQKIVSSIPKRRSIGGSLRHEVFKRDNYRCKDCGANKKSTKLHVDHIISVSQGGTDELDNLQTLCEQCNLEKSNSVWSITKKNKTLNSFAEAN